MITPTFFEDTQTRTAPTACTHCGARLGAKPLMNDEDPFCTLECVQDFLDELREQWRYDEDYSRDR